MARSQPAAAGRRRRRIVICAFAAVALGGAVMIGAPGGRRSDPAPAPGSPAPTNAPPAAEQTSCPAKPPSYPPGMPPSVSCRNIYAATGANAVAAQVAGDPPRIYVPNTLSDSVSVIDPVTRQVTQTINVGSQPQHVTPSWDLRTLWVDNDKGNSLTPIDPMTGTAGAPVPVVDPYNLYFTPDGTRAVVMAEAKRRMDFRDPHTMALLRSLGVPCSGLNHMDFSADGRTALASCEFDGQLLVVDMTPGEEKVLRVVKVGGKPQDVKLAPDASVYYVADLTKNGVHVIDAATFTEISFLKTGKGAHGLYPSRDDSQLYVTNRGEGSVSVIDLTRRRVSTKWVFDGGHGSPDMGGVSADGTTLWVTGRDDGEVYAIDTATGRLVVPPIRVGQGPHGACVWPQPGRYSMGHTGILR